MFGCYLLWIIWFLCSHICQHITKLVAILVLSSLSLSSFVHTHVRKSAIVHPALLFKTILSEKWQSLAQISLTSLHSQNKWVAISGRFLHKTQLALTSSPLLIRFVRVGRISWYILHPQIFIFAGISNFQNLFQRYSWSSRFEVEASFDLLA